MRPVTVGIVVRLNAKTLGNRASITGDGGVLAHDLLVQTDCGVQCVCVCVCVWVGGPSV